jgi:hypothetical protein
MLSKFAIDYVALPQHHSRRLTHLTDDPVEAEEFLMYLLASRARILEVRHEGAPLSGPQFDRMLKVAAERIASGLLRESLHLDAVTVRDRFGLAA